MSNITTPIRAMTGDEAAEAGFVPGMDFVTCDICDKAEFFTEGVSDWNGETGAHLTCEAREAQSRVE